MPMLLPYALALATTTAVADAPLATEGPDVDRFLFTLGLGAGGALSGIGGGLELDLGLGLRFDALALGIAGGVSAYGLTSGAASLSLQAGPTFELEPGNQLDLLAELGVREEYQGGQLFDGDPGVSQSYPFLGARIGVDWALGDPMSAVVFRLGLQGWARADLAGPDEFAYEYEDCFFTCSTESAEHELGGVVDLGALVTLSLDFAMN